MDEITIAQVIAGLMAFAFEFAPGLATWWENTLMPKQKVYITAVMVFVLTVAVTAVECTRGGVCPTDWANYIAAQFMIMLGINQAAFLLTKGLK